MKPRFIIIGVAAAILAVGILGYHFFAKPHSEVLTLFGNVDIRSVDLGFRVPGRIAAMSVDEGAKVKEGEILTRLDTQPLTDALNAAEAQIGAATAQLDKLRNGNRPQDIAQAQAVVADRTAAVAQARAEYERRAELVKTGAVSQALFDASQAQYLGTQAQLHSAEQMLSLQRAGARSEDIEAAVAQLSVATAQRDKARTDLADAKILAPAAGTILTRAREPGAIALAGETIFVLTINRPMRVRAYVAEIDVGRISPGMEALVTADGNPRTYHGTIGFISPTAEFTPKTVQTESLRTELVYRLRVIVTDPDDALRQGQPVTIAIPAARSAAQRQ
jgi:HlyD family secretion protein